MANARIRANEAQKNNEPTRPSGHESIRQQVPRTMQQVAPDTAYRRTQVNRIELRPVDFLTLQRTVGNRIVQRATARRMVNADDQQETGFTKGEPEIAVQTKLTVGAPDDVYEQEADRVAGQVMTMPDTAARRPNQTGLPDGLKSGVETLSGMSMDGVNVHYNSSQPAQLNALAYTQGSDIHVAPGQERHLPHEAWHVVQQAQGRVQPTMQMKDGVPVNDDQGLEREADVMGAKALKMRRIEQGAAHWVVPRSASHVLQYKWKEGVDGPPDFDPGVAVAGADWSTPKYVSVNLGAKQPKDKDWRSYRITAWAPAIVGKWEVTVAAHSYFEANEKTKKVRRTQYGHLYVNDWEGWSTEDDECRNKVYDGVKNQLFSKMDAVMKIANGSVDVVGKYDRASYLPRRTNE